MVKFSIQHIKPNDSVDLLGKTFWCYFCSNEYKLNKIISINYILENHLMIEHFAWYIQNCFKFISTHVYFISYLLVQVMRIIVKNSLENIT